MKILFLDIDGVLNSSDNMSAQDQLYIINNSNIYLDKYGVFFDERCVRWLRFIIEKTDCKIVISSAWRFAGLKAMKAMWKLRNLPGEVIDRTPFDASESTKNRYNEDSERGLEIQEWLDINKPENYCIVDDEIDMLSHQNFIRTDSEYGLNRRTALDIVKILNCN